MSAFGSKSDVLANKKRIVLRILRYVSEVCDNKSIDTRTSADESTDVTHKRIISAPISFTTSLGEMMLPNDLDIFSPFPSKTNPCDKTDL